MMMKRSLEERTLPSDYSRRWGAFNVSVNLSSMNMWNKLKKHYCFNVTAFILDISRHDDNAEWAQNKSSINKINFTNMNNKFFYKSYLL